MLRTLRRGRRGALCASPLACSLIHSLSKHSSLRGDTGCNRVARKDTWACVTMRAPISLPVRRSRCVESSRRPSATQLGMLLSAGTAFPVSRSPFLFATSDPPGRERTAASLLQRGPRGGHRDAPMSGCTGSGPKPFYFSFTWWPLRPVLLSLSSLTHCHPLQTGV